MHVCAKGVLVGLEGSKQQLLALTRPGHQSSNLGTKAAVLRCDDCAPSSN